jgi:ParB-like chromosome segregation protein Spo0J
MAQAKRNNNRNATGGTAADATTRPSTGTASASLRVEQVNPATLLVDVNVRGETVADKDLIASIKDLGVLRLIRAVRTADGSLRVETGHRRTLAAIEAGLAAAPVLAIVDEHTDSGVWPRCGRSCRTRHAVRQRRRD